VKITPKIIIFKRKKRKKKEEEEEEGRILHLLNKSKRSIMEGIMGVKLLALFRSSCKIPPLLVPLLILLCYSFMIMFALCLLLKGKSPKCV
jgi:hypothetical protein